MIRLFRKIRQNLLLEKKIGRYLTYAIGEIFLVVIGILIALQVNNWNENRKSLKLEASYYENLYLDLRQDSLEIEFKIKNAETNIKKLENILRLIHNDYDITKTHVDSVEWPANFYYKDSLALVLSVSQAGFVQFVDIYKNTIEDLLSTGSIKILKNKQLKENILQYYSRDKTRENWNSVLVAARLDMERSINKVLTAKQRTAYSEEEQLQLHWDEFQEFIARLKSVSEFEENLIGMLHLHSRIIRQSNNQMLKVTDLLAQLRAEIKEQ